MKYTKSALGLLNAQYRSVLKKCFLINLGLFALAAISATPAKADPTITVVTSGLTVDTTTSVSNQAVNGTATATISGITKDDVSGLGTMATEDKANYYTKTDAAAVFVAKETGKGLTSNDYTDNDKALVATISYKADSADLATANGKITALETAVGNASSGLVKDVNDLKTTAATLKSGAQADVLSGTIAGNTSSSNLVTAAQVAAYAQEKITDSNKLSSTLVEGLKSGATTDVLSSTIAGNTSSSNLVTAAQVAAYAQEKITDSNKLSSTLVEGLKSGATTDVLSGTIAGNTSSSNLVTAAQVADYAQAKLTTDQQSAVDSGIDSTKVASYDALVSATTLAGYGITDAYTKTEVNSAIDNMVTTIPADGKITFKTSAGADEAITYDATKIDSKLNDMVEVTDGVITFKKADGTDETTAYTKAQADSVFQDATEVKALIGGAAGNGLTGDTTAGTLTVKASNGITVDGNGVSVKAKDKGGLSVTSDGVAVNVDATTIKLSDTGSLQIVDKGVGKNQLADAINNNLLNNANTSAGLTITDGDDTTAAKIALNVSATGGLEEDATNGLQIKAAEKGGIKVNGDGVSVDVDGSTLALDTTSGKVKIADKGVNTAQIADAAVTATQLAANAVETDKIKNDAVTLDKIADANWTKDAVDAGATGSDTALATTSSVVGTITNQAQDATFTPTATNLEATTIKGALNELGAENAVQNTIIGAAMKADGTANTAALTLKKQDGSAVTDLTSAVNLIGDLHSTGIAQGTIAGQIGAITAANIQDRSKGAILASNTVAANIQALDTAIGANVTNTTNGAAVTNSVNENIDAVNTALGNVAGLGAGDSVNYTGVSGYNATAPGANLTAAVSKLNQNVHSTLGGMYKTDGTFNNDQLKGTNGFDNDAGNTNLTAALKNYANNAQAATGVTYAEDGTVTTAYAARTGTGDYTALADGTSLRVAIEHLDNNIGNAIAAADISARTTGAIAADNTVNANIAALDAAIGADVDAAALFNGVVAAGTVNENIGAINATIGDIDTLAEDNNGGVGTTVGNALSNGGGAAGKPTTVVEALNNIDATLGKIHGLKAVSTLGAGSNLAAGTTVDQHLDKLDQAIGDRTNLASLNADINNATKQSVAKGLETAGNKIGDADFSSTKYASGDTDLSSAVRSLDRNIYRIDQEVSDLKHDFRAGMASMAAMTALVPNARSQGDTSLSLGTGAYEGHTAMAIGGFHYINDNILLNAGVSWSNTSDAAYRIGVTYSF